MSCFISCSTPYFRGRKMLNYSWCGGNTHSKWGRAHCAFVHMHRQHHLNNHRWFSALEAAAAAQGHTVHTPTTAFERQFQALLLWFRPEIQIPSSSPNQTTWRENWLIWSRHCLIKKIQTLMTVTKYQLVQTKTVYGPSKQCCLMFGFHTHPEIC